MTSYSVDFDTTPVLTPPEGVIPNFVDPTSNAYISRNVACIFLPFMLIFLALRLCSRTIVTHSFGIDDVLHILAGASVIMRCGIMLSLLDRPNGRHLWDVPLSLITDSYLKVNFTYVIMGAVSLMLVKVSLLALYLRLFGSVRRVKLSIYICMGIVTAFYIATIVAELVVGVSSHGVTWQVAQTRYGPFGLDISGVRGIFGIVSDFAILSIPLTQAFKIQIALKRKIVLACVFLTGLLACVSSIVSCVQRFREQGNQDYTWANTMPNAFSTIELTVGHICGSLPTLPALVKYLSKNEKFLSTLSHMRSRLNTRDHNAGPICQPSPRNAEKLHRDSRGRLTSLKTFVQEAHLATFSRHQRTERIFTNCDIESIDVDYHSQLKNVAARDQIRHSEIANGGAELPESI